METGIKFIFDSDGKACEVKSDENTSNNQNTDKVETVKVPSTGLNAQIIFTVVGLAIIIISGIVIWIFVKDKKLKKN